VLPGDLDANGLVDIEDLMQIISRWSEACDGTNDNCDGADLNGNGEVDMGDLLIIISNWSL
jgi:hypothetical protein